MKKLVFKLCALVLPFLLFIAVCDHRANRTLWNIYAAKKELLKAQASKTEVLVLGASQVYFGVRPELFGRPSFNLSFPNQTFYYDRALLKKYLDALPSLKLVVLPVTDRSLYRQMENSVEPWRCYYYRYEFKFPHRDWHMAWHARNFSAFFLGRDEVGLKRMVTGRVPNVSRQFDPSGGWHPDHPEQEETNRTPEEVAAKLRKTAAAALHRHLAASGSDVAENEQILTDMVAEVRRRGLDVVLLECPSSRYYNDGINAKDYAHLQDFLTSLCNKYNVKHCNYMRDQRFVDHDFSDGDHLNEIGAQKFSTMIGEEIVAPCFASGFPKPNPTPALNHD
jgi:hypothetical protein